MSGWELPRNVSFGYASHNDVWGADVFAHGCGLTNADPELGAKVALTALPRMPAFNDLLVAGIDCAPEALVRQTELAYRQQTSQLGLLLLGPEDQHLATIAEPTTAVAPAFLAANGLEFPARAELLLAELNPRGTGRALALREDDYLDELDAIIENLEADMADHGVKYWF